MNSTTINRHFELLQRIPHITAMAATQLSHHSEEELKEFTRNIVRIKI